MRAPGRASRRRSARPARGLDLVGDVGQRVPPPGRPVSRRRCPAGRRPTPVAALGARAAGGVDDVALVRRGQHRAGRVEDRGDGARGGLAGAGAPDVEGMSSQDWYSGCARQTTSDGRSGSAGRRRHARGARAVALAPLRSTARRRSRPRPMCGGGPVDAPLRRAHAPHQHARRPVTEPGRRRPAGRSGPACPEPRPRYGRARGRRRPA